MLSASLISTLFAMTFLALLAVAYRRERRTRRLLREIVDSVPGGFIMWDAQDRLVMCNQAVRDTYALSSAALRPGATFESVIRFGVSRGQYPQAIGREEDFVQSLVGAHQRGCQTAERQLPNGRWILIHEERTPSGNIVAIRSDITGLKMALAKAAEAHDVAHHMAHHDALTGLPNRVLFTERLDAAIRAFRGGGPAFAVLCLDLDRFKAVNDELGHAGGDELLSAVAGRMAGAAGEGDLAARLGGDEFAMLVFGGDPGPAAEETAGRLVASVGAPYRLMTGRAAIGVSVGIALVGADCTANDLMCRADRALYDAKRAGRGTFRRAA